MSNDDAADQKNLELDRLNLLNKKLKEVGHSNPSGVWKNEVAGKKLRDWTLIRTQGRNGPATN